jgi:type III restriction enzyme
MALHPEFPASPFETLDPNVRWFPADEAFRDTGMEKLMPPLVGQIRRKVKEFRDDGYFGATETSKALLHWWFDTPHFVPKHDAPDEEFRYYFAQREAMETIIYLHDVVGARDKFDLMRFDSVGLVSANMFDETWSRFVVKMATGPGKTKRLSQSRG